MLTAVRKWSDVGRDSGLRWCFSSVRFLLRRGENSDFEGDVVRGELWDGGWRRPPPLIKSMTDDDMMERERVEDLLLATGMVTSEEFENIRDKRHKRWHEEEARRERVEKERLERDLRKAGRGSTCVIGEDGDVGAVVGEAGGPRAAGAVGSSSSRANTMEQQTGLGEGHSNVADWWSWDQEEQSATLEHDGTAAHLFAPDPLDEDATVFEDSQSVDSAATVITDLGGRFGPGGQRQERRERRTGARKDVVGGRDVVSGREDDREKKRDMQILSKVQRLVAAKNAKLLQQAPAPLQRRAGAVQSAGLRPRGGRRRNKEDGGIVVPAEEDKKLKVHQRRAKREGSHPHPSGATSEGGHPHQQQINNPRETQFSTRSEKVQHRVAMRQHVERDRGGGDD